MILEYLKQKKQDVDMSLDLFIDSKITELSSIHELGGKALERLKIFGKRGKGIRGVLTVLGAELYGNKDNGILTVASAMELIHSSLLIHDDIIDDDEMRRGFPTIFKQYSDDGERLNLKKPKFYGQSMGICAGDIGLYFAILQISESDIEITTKNHLISLITSEISKTAVAEMMDVLFGFSSEETQAADIQTVYLYKTGRYTFSLPLMLGGIYAGKALSELKTVEEYGEHLGIVFQIVDDWLGLFADEAELGKPIGSDIRENKKTLIRQMLFSKVGNEDKKTLENIFGKEHLTIEDIQIVRKAILLNGIKNDIDIIITEKSEKALALVETLEVESKYKEILKSLVEYNIKRSK
jgi:geranylgeranyl diphosphate synthase, type I